MKKNNIHLSVIIPSYNEMNNIARGVLDHVYDFLKKQTYTWELILSDDGSTDGTIRALETFAKKKKGVCVLKNKHAGKGPTVTKGMLQAKGEWRVFTDFDQATPIETVNKVLSHTKEYDVIIASRETKGAKRIDEPVSRHVMGRMFNFAVQLFALPGIDDSQCGFKMFSKRATEKLFPSLVVYGNNEEKKDAYLGAFDVELLFLARKWNFTIKEIPIVWKYAPTNRLHPIRDSLLMLRDLVRIRLAWLQNKY